MLSDARKIITVAAPAVAIFCAAQPAQAGWKASPASSSVGSSSSKSRVQRRGLSGRR